MDLFSVVCVVPIPCDAKNGADASDHHKEAERRRLYFFDGK